jgi:hypothetical protein
MEHSPDQSHEQQYEGKKREQGIGRHGECKRMYLGA